MKYDSDVKFSNSFFENPENIVDDPISYQKKWNTQNLTSSGVTIPQGKIGKISKKIDEVKHKSPQLTSKNNFLSDLKGNFIITDNKILDSKAHYQINKSVTKVEAINGFFYLSGRWVIDDSDMNLILDKMPAKLKKKITSLVCLNKVDKELKSNIWVVPDDFDIDVIEPVSGSSGTVWVNQPIQYSQFVKADTEKFEISSHEDTSKDEFNDTKMSTNQENLNNVEVIAQLPDVTSHSDTVTENPKMDSPSSIQDDKLNMILQQIQIMTIQMAALQEEIQMLREENRLLKQENEKLKNPPAIIENKISEPFVVSEPKAEERVDEPQSTTSALSQDEKVIPESTKVEEKVNENKEEPQLTTPKDHSQSETQTEQKDKSKKVPRRKLIKKFTDDGKDIKLQVEPGMSSKEALKVVANNTLPTDVKKKRINAGVREFPKAPEKLDENFNKVLSKDLQQSDQTIRVAKNKPAKLERASTIITFTPKQRENAKRVNDTPPGFIAPVWIAIKKKHKDNPEKLDEAVKREYLRILKSDVYTYRIRWIKSYKPINPLLCSPKDIWETISKNPTYQDIYAAIKIWRKQVREFVPAGVTPKPKWFEQ